MRPCAGPGARDEQGKLVPLELKEGDRILFGKWSGTEVRIDGEEFLIMKESDVLGVVEGRGNDRGSDRVEGRAHLRVAA